MANFLARVAELKAKAEKCGSVGNEVQWVIVDNRGYQAGRTDDDRLADAANVARLEFLAVANPAMILEMAEKIEVMHSFISRIAELLPMAPFVRPSTETFNSMILEARTIRDTLK